MMRVLVISSCTGEKVVDSDRQLTAEDFQKGHAHVAKREKEVKELLGLLQLIQLLQMLLLLLQLL